MALNTQRISTAVRSHTGHPTHYHWFRRRLRVGPVCTKIHNRPQSAANPAASHAARFHPARLTRGPKERRNEPPLINVQNKTIIWKKRHKKMTKTRVQSVLHFRLITLESTATIFTQRAPADRSRDRRKPSSGHCHGGILPWAVLLLRKFYPGISSSPRRRRGHRRGRRRLLGQERRLRSICEKDLGVREQDSVPKWDVTEWGSKLLGLCWSSWPRCLMSLMGDTNVRNLATKWCCIYPTCPCN